MKKTLTINLNNVVFHIDDDAFELLRNYLLEIEKQLSIDERKEVMSDIEARVAELFTERLQRNKTVINMTDIEEIIEILGKPNAFGGEDEANESEASTKKEKKRSRRFYRDPENLVLGGVCGGLSVYLGMDVTILRIIFVLLVFLGVGTIIPVYLIVWLIAPAAVSVSQRLEMQGEDVTVDAIKSEFKNVKNYVESDKFKDSANSIGNRIGGLLGIVFKALFGFVGAILAFVGVIVVGALFLALLFFIFEPAVFNGFSSEFIPNITAFNSEKTLLLLIALLLVVGCPLFMIVYWLIRLLNGRKDHSKTTSWAVFILWLAGLFMLYSVGAKTLIRWNNSNQPWLNFEVTPSVYIEEDRNLALFREIDLSGNVELEFTQDSLKYIRVSAPENTLNSVITKVENGVLKVYSEKIFLNKPIKMYVSNDSLLHIKATGASKVRTTNQLKGNYLSIDVSGASNVKMDVNMASGIEIDADGASYCDIDGETQSIDIEVSGASKVETDQLKAQSAKVEASGASHARVFATVTLDADASGASKISCEGAPININKSESGAGKVSVK